MYKKCEEILKELESQNKLKVWWDFKFPEKEELKLRLKDILEEEVDEKYYLTDSMINYLENGKYNSAKVSNKLKQTATGISPTLDTMQGGNRQPLILEEKLPDAYGKNFGNKGKIQEEIYDMLQTAMGCGGENVPLIKKEVERTPLKFLNRNQKNIEGDYAFCVDSCNTGEIKEIQSVIIDDTQGFDRVRYYKQYSPTIRASRSGLKTIYNNTRIRKLTPKECWRLMRL